MLTTEDWLSSADDAHSWLKFGTKHHRGESLKEAACCMQLLDITEKLPFLHVTHRL